MSVTAVMIMQFIEVMSAITVMIMHFIERNFLEPMDWTHGHD